MHAGREPVLRGTFLFMAVQLHWQICCWLLRLAVPTSAGSSGDPGMSRAFIA